MEALLRVDELPSAEEAAAALRAVESAGSCAPLDAGRVACAACACGGAEAGRFVAALVAAAERGEGAAACALAVLSVGRDASVSVAEPASGGAPRAACFVLGFGGSAPADLVPFQDAVTAAGCRAVALTKPIYRCCADAQRKALATHVANARVEGLPLLVHALSNTGVLLLLDLLEHGVLRVDELAGVALDSAPAESCSAELMQGVLQGCLANLLKAHYRGDTGKAMKTVGGVMPHLARLAVEELSFFDWGGGITDLAGRLPACPRLFLFSAEDKLIPASGVRAFAAKCAPPADVPQTLVEFARAPHVQCLRVERDTYAAAVDTHVAAAQAYASRRVDAALQQRLDLLIDILAEDYPDVEEPPPNLLKTEAQVREWFESGGRTFPAAAA